jgi:hypothetical protein
MAGSTARLLSTLSWLVLATAGAGAAPAPATPPPVPAVGTFSADVPTVDAAGSNVSAADLKAILSGDIAGHLDQLAHLNATHIRVPIITLHFKSTEPGSAPIDVVYKDLDLEAVSDGVAKSVTLGLGESTQPDGTHFEFGKSSMQAFNLGGLLAFYGLVSGSTDQPLATMYKSFDAEGMTFSGKDFRCDIGPISTGEFKARPLKMPFGELMTLVSSPQFQPGGQPSPEAVGKLVSFYIDFFDAFETAPAQVKSLDCSGTDTDGKAVAVGMGPFSIGGFTNRRYPAIEVKNVKILAADGKVTLGDFIFKSFDLSGPFKLLQSQAGNLTEAWFTANARKLIPAFEGLSLANLNVDVPDDQNPGERVKANVGDFDLSLANYLEGVPTSITAASHHIAVDVPPAVEGGTDQFDGLRQMGIDKLDLGFDLGLHRDATAKSIVIDKLALSGDKMGSVTLSGTLGNADDALFSGDTESAMAAAMAVTLKAAKVGVVDAGLADLILKRVGSEQGMDLATARSQLSGMAQGIVLVGLGGTPAAKALGDAVGKFIAGGKSLTVTVTANAVGGLTAADFAAAQSDPKTLDDKVMIDAAAE